MKFAKELEQEHVPEWRAKYLDYKAGKKKVKAVSRAYHRAPPTPSTTTGGTVSANRTPFSASISAASRPWDRSPAQSQSKAQPHLRLPDETTRLRPPQTSSSSPGLPITHPHIHKPNDDSDRAGHLGSGTQVRDMQYGSFGLTPHLPTTPQSLGRIQSNRSFELPGPAIGVPSDPASPRDDTGPLNYSPRPDRRPRPPPPDPKRSMSAAGLPTTSHLTPSLSRASEYLPATAGTPPAISPRHRLHRMISAALPTKSPRIADIGMQVLALDIFRQKEKEFFDFMASELQKVESFYKLKEDEAGQRLVVLEDQLREMRNRRALQVNEERQKRKQGPSNGDTGEPDGKPTGPAAGAGADPGYLDQVKSKIFRPGPNSRALSRMIQTPVLHPQSQPGLDLGRDYVRRPESTQGPPYKTAKRKLKLALQELYRAMELLKSYALLNRTAFRKLNKKYDKAVEARSSNRMRFMNEKVSKSWFVNSEVLDRHMKTVEDLYAKYFERDNHKIAVSKLKSLIKRRKDESSSSFRSGVFLGTGLVFAVQGTTFAVQLLFGDDDTLAQQTAYLLQIYAGYFLMLFLFSLFVVNCYVWTKNKINYPFIFEFDQRHHLDWRRLAEFPSFFLFLLGVFLWLNFSRYGSPALFLYYPVMLIGLSVVIIFLPAPILAPSSRRWFAYAHWRLLLAGLYPVEFRDFFLGDIYCSLTYAVCNVSLFFCLYANHWDDPPQCNSNRSRLMGFLAALPPIWRFFQCLRRYRDTRNIFPHLVNGGKYSMSIMTAVSLSIYRIQGSRGNLAFFLVFGLINGLYTSVWDLFMDFSLLQPNAHQPLLRDITALKKRWVYYVIMVVDPVLRFAWIFYAIFAHNRQHSTIVSFLVAFAEAFRRGIWALLRVENEHCSNVAVYKAYRDVPLPYRLRRPLVERPSEEEEEEEEGEEAVAPEAEGISPRPEGERRRVPVTGEAEATGVQRAGLYAIQDEEAAAGLAAGVEPPERPSTLRRRKTVEPMRPVRRFSRILADAHLQDFEKRRKPTKGDAEGSEEVEHRSAHSDDDDDIDEDELDIDAEDEENGIHGDGFWRSNDGGHGGGASGA
ncbi:EXS-domain-containing protein [Sodiomyces alkalinus F11]|uniref:EXS-domain-containing protein n=1 Tax=Sodiomyces alkalinus (strain CBS 110278 / VKM F-3762 / F11) TaxID=1314773 RepID=A0A3N2PWQ3_SODAK|nr:EXS-domain-containing protein [Sodiomyces alkalinus F11]ROT38953.1 EXS-domain-containing protein [Sodiomyces alkalinus F11]